MPEQTLPAALLIAAISVYRRFLSPLLPPACRFAPTCSAYAAEAVAGHGALRGTWLAIRRLLRCHPGHPGGWDPVPSPPGRKQFADGSQDDHGIPVDGRATGSVSGHLS